MLRFKDPLRLPGGIRIDICDPSNILSDYKQRLKDAFFGSINKISHPATPSKQTTAPADPEEADTSSNLWFDGHAYSSRYLSSTTTYLFIQNVPIPVSSIFFQYLLLWRRLTWHYISPYVIKCLIIGEPIKPVPVLQVMWNSFTLKRKLIHCSIRCYLKRDPPYKRSGNSCWNCTIINLNIDRFVSLGLQVQRLKSLTMSIFSNDTNDKYKQCTFF
jgi:hypothetical protein